MPSLDETNCQPITTNDGRELTPCGDDEIVETLSRGGLPSLRPFRAWRAGPRYRLRVNRAGSGLSQLRSRHHGLATQVPPAVDIAAAGRTEVLLVVFRPVLAKPEIRNFLIRRRDNYPDAGGSSFR